MNLRPHDMLDEAIRALRNTVSGFGDRKLGHGMDTETADLISSLSQLPKKEIPEPVMQRKYLTTTAAGQRVWFAWLHVSRVWTASVSFVMLLALFGTTAYASLRSLPGQKLFTLKRSAEQLQLSLERDPVQRANIQTAIAQKRLQDAQRVFSSETKNPKLEVAALTELSKATQKSVDVVRSAASSGERVQQTTTMVAKLEDITQKQQALLQTIEPESPIQVAAAQAIHNSKSAVSQVEEIKKSIEIAGVPNEQTLTTLPSPTSTPVSENPATATSTPAVKGTATTSKPSIIAKPSSTPPTMPNASTTTATTTPVDPNAAVGGFILEDPSPQFAP